jgi:hypothetical protein
VPRTRTPQALALALAALALTPVAHSDAARARPNLVAKKVGVSVVTVTAGRSLTVSDRTKNTGTAAAARSLTVYYLSTDARRSPDDTRLGSRKVPSLAPGKASAGRLMVVVPAATSAGPRFVLACADQKKKVKEQSEKDNCRASRRVTVASPSSPPPPHPTTSDQLAAVRAAADGPVSLPVTGAVVTFVKPSVGSDASGFFVQGRQTGPALFVAVDPATLTPSPATGDRVSFTVTQMATLDGLRYAAAIGGYSRTATGVDTTILRQDLSAAVDLVSNVDAYDSELVRLSGTVSDGFTAAGDAHVSATLATAGAPSEPGLRLRLPTVLREALDLTEGCALTATGPMWRSTATALPSVYEMSDVQVVDCPAPTVVSAVATSPTSVVVSFDRRIDPTSVAPDASQFVADNGLGFVAASASGTTVTLTSTPQSSLSYTVTVQPSVLDTLGNGVGSPSSAVFTGLAPVAALVLNEISPNIGSSRDLVELRATSAGTTDGITIEQDGSTVEVLATLPAIDVAVGDLVVVHLAPAGATGAAPGSETTSKTQHPAASFGANYDGAWDVHGGDVGLVHGNRVLFVRSPSDTVQDAVPVVLSTTPSPPAAFPGDLQAVQSAGLWLPVDCGGTPCTYASTPTAPAVSVDYLGVGTTAAGSSVSREPTQDTNSREDWNAAAAQSMGLPNP